MSTNQTINRLVAQYLQQLETPSLSLPDGPTLINPAVQRAIYTRMFDESATWPLPPIHYRARVLKMILSRIEESVVDPEEDVCFSFFPSPLFCFDCRRITVSHVACRMSQEKKNEVIETKKINQRKNTGNLRRPHRSLQHPNMHPQALLHPTSPTTHLRNLHRAFALAFPSHNTHRQRQPPPHNHNLRIPRPNPRIRHNRLPHLGGLPPPRHIPIHTRSRSPSIREEGPRAGRGDGLPVYVLRQIPTAGFCLRYRYGACADRWDGG